MKANKLKKVRKVSEARTKISSAAKPPRSRSVTQPRSKSKGPRERSTSCKKPKSNPKKVKSTVMLQEDYRVVNLKGKEEQLNKFLQKFKRLNKGHSFFSQPSQSSIKKVSFQREPCTPLRSQTKQQRGQERKSSKLKLTMLIQTLYKVLVRAKSKAAQVPFLLIKQKGLSKADQEEKVQSNEVTHEAKQKQTTPERQVCENQFLRQLTPFVPKKDPELEDRIKKRQFQKIEAMVSEIRQPQLQLKFLGQLIPIKSNYQSLQGIKTAVFELARMQGDTKQSNQTKTEVLQLVDILRTKVWLAAKNKEATFVPQINLKLTQDRIEESIFQQKEKYFLQQGALGEARCRRMIKNGQLPLENSQGFSTSQVSLGKVMNVLANFLEVNCQSQIISLLNTLHGVDSITRLARLQNRQENHGIQHLRIVQVYNQNLAKTLQAKFVSTMVKGLRRDVKPAEEYHWHAIFDCFFEQLNFYRPYFNLGGDPYPWVVSERGMTYFNINEEFTLVFDKVKQKLFEFNATMCGLILELDQPVPCLGHHCGRLSNFPLLDRQLLETQQAMVKKEVEEEQVLWILFGQETTALLLGLASQVQDRLLTQLLKQLTSL